MIRDSFAGIVAPAFLAVGARYAPRRTSTSELCRATKTPCHKRFRLACLPQEFYWAPRTPCPVSCGFRSHCILAGTLSRAAARRCSQRPRIKGLATVHCDRRSAVHDGGRFRVDGVVVAIAITIFATRLLSWLYGGVAMKRRENNVRLLRFWGRTGNRRF